MGKDVHLCRAAATASAGLCWVDVSCFWTYSPGDSDGLAQNGPKTDPPSCASPDDLPECRPQSWGHCWGAGALRPGGVGHGAGTQGNRTSEDSSRVGHLWFLLSPLTWQKTGGSQLVAVSPASCADMAAGRFQINVRKPETDLTPPGPRASLCLHCPPNAD